MGLVQKYEKECGFDRGVVSGDTNKLKDFCADANSALDDVVRIALRSSGKWQFDDSNQEDYPIITANLESGRREYQFTDDEAENIILEVQKVLVADRLGQFIEIKPKDPQTEPYTKRFWDGQNSTGIPTAYDKNANAIFFDLIPDYSVEDGIKMYIDREASYFAFDDTDKKAGIPGVLHKFLYLKPALDYARRNTLASYTRIQKEVTMMEGDESQGITGTIAEYFSARPKDERGRLSVKRESNK